MAEGVHGGQTLENFSLRFLWANEAQPRLLMLIENEGECLDDTLKDYNPKTSIIYIF